MIAHEGGGEVVVRIAFEVAPGSVPFQRSKPSLSAKGPSVCVVFEGVSQRAALWASPGKSEVKGTAGIGVF